MLIVISRLNPIWGKGWKSRISRKSGPHFFFWETSGTHASWSKKQSLETHFSNKKEKKEKQKEGLETQYCGYWQTKTFYSMTYSAIPRFEGITDCFTFQTKFIRLDTFFLIKHVPRMLIIDIELVQDLDLNVSDKGSKKEH